MTRFRWTLDHLRTAEEAVERHRRLIANGEREPSLIRRDPGCDRGCPQCDLMCAIMVSAVEVTRRGLAEQGKLGEGLTWELRHAGRSYAAAAGRA
jgi:hypothetical protein